MRWLLTSWGSSGDLHPFLALGRGLLARGHDVTLVGHPEWAKEAEQAGVRFSATDEPPRGNPLREHPDVLSTRWGGVPSLRALMRLGIVPSLRPTLEAVRREVSTHDVVVAHHFTFPGSIAAEIAGVPWATVTLAPGVIPSAYSVPGSQFGRAGSGVLARARNRFVWRAGRWCTQQMVDPAVNQLRRECGLAPVRDVIFGALSPALNLQLYSRHFAPPAPDWSAEKRQAGFCYYDPPGEKLGSEVEEFLRVGEPPVLFTLGTTAVRMPGGFFAMAAEVCRRAGVRGMLVLGPEGRPPEDLPGTVLATRYLPYGLVMPRVRAVVHQCGIGTLSHTLRAGVPSVAVPFAFDQPNNARRLEELGVAELVKPRQRNVEAMTRALQRLLAGDATARAKEIGEKIRAEDGVAQACAILGETFRR